MLYPDDGVSNFHRNGANNRLDYAAFLSGTKSETLLNYKDFSI
jgi:hypothetical protein